MINDSQTLNGARSRFGSEIPVYDDGFGPLFIHRHSIGISGIVRARTWEDAYSICEDEFFPEASETIEELRAEYNHKRESVKIIRDASGVERAAKYPEDYPGGTLSPDVSFVRWETVTTPAPEGEEIWTENELFCEAFGFRPNGLNAGDKLKHGIYAKDLNGDSLDLLTPELLAQLEITLDIRDSE